MAFRVAADCKLAANSWKVELWDSNSNADSNSTIQIILVVVLTGGGHLVSIGAPLSCVTLRCSPPIGVSAGE